MSLASVSCGSSRFLPQSEDVQLARKGDLKLSIVINVRVNDWRVSAVIDLSFHTVRGVSQLPAKCVDVKKKRDGWKVFTWQLDDRGGESGKEALIYNRTSELVMTLPDMTWRNQWRALSGREGPLWWHTAPQLFRCQCYHKIVWIPYMTVYCNYLTL